MYNDGWASNSRIALRCPRCGNDESSDVSWHIDQLVIPHDHTGVISMHPGSITTCCACDFFGSEELFEVAGRC